MPLDLFSRKLVLLVEDEPLIALDIEHRLRSEGVRVITAGHLDAALYMAEHPDLSSAVVDLCLGEESATPIFRRLAHRNLPFVVYTGYATEALAREWPSATIIQKPASLDIIADALAVLCRHRTCCLPTMPSIHSGPQTRHPPLNEAARQARGLQYQVGHTASKIRDALLFRTS